MDKIVIMASGNGSNAQRIAEYFQTNEEIEIAAIFSNNSKAYVLKRARQLGISAELFSKADLNGPRILEMLEKYETDYIVLAGFLWKVPEHLIRAYPDKILNIHPSLLPKFGGKGMYGNHVHKAVLAQNENESGITIHLVNEQYDQGAILFQARCDVLPNDTPGQLAERIHQLEYKHYPEVIHSYIKTHS